MDYATLVEFVQAQFTDGLALVIGSGLSASEGIPGMPDLATHLCDRAAALTGADATLWESIVASLDANAGLETALFKHPPSAALEAWITRETCALLMPEERQIISEVIRGERVLRLTTFLEQVLKPKGGLPILTTNYDRLIELSCEMAGFCVDTTAIGLYAGSFDDTRSFMASCRGVTMRAKNPTLDYFPRAVVLKPHGSFDWYQSKSNARRCCIDLDADRLIITPGTNKYRAGYNSPFDRHRELANSHLDRAAHILVVGYGFNDDHLQTHLERRIRDGIPTLVLNRSVNDTVLRLVAESPLCVCLSQLDCGTGATAITKEGRFPYPGKDLWDIGVLAREILT